MNTEEPTIVWHETGTAFRDLYVHDIDLGRYIVESRNPVAYGENIFEQIIVPSVEHAIQYIIQRDNEIAEAHEFG